MKTASANLGLGDTSSSRRRNNRVKKIDQKGWGFKRRAFFNRNVKFAAAAKAFRVVHDVTQVEVAAAFNVAQGTVCNWESGKYAWRGGNGELQQYCQVIEQIARGS